MRWEGPRAGTFVLAAALTALVVVALGRGLIQETWVAGDSGVKLVATRNALQHPSSPLEIPLPVIGGHPVPLVEPFFRVHGDHSHAVTPETFVLASAPLLGWFGIRGLYILPAAGVVLALVSWMWIGARLVRGANPWLIWGVALVGTPWLFYGLEFWEHAPALGLASLGTALLLPTGATRRWHVLAAGFCLGLAVLLRPEAAWYAGAITLALGSQHQKPFIAIALVAGAGMLTLVPWAYVTYIHFGTLASPHLGGLGGLFEPGWWETRAELFRTWFLVPSSSNAWRVAPLLVLGLIPSSRIERRWRLVLLSTSFATIVGIWLTAPNDGGAQWGPRYLLLACGPLVPLAAATLQGVLTRQSAGVALVIAALAGAAWVQRDGYRDLRGSKETYARMVGFIRSAAGPDARVLTDLWWLDQVAASLDDVTFLFVSNESGAVDALGQLATAREPRVTIISGGESPVMAAAAPAHPCYRVARVDRHSERALVATTVELICGR